MIDNKLETKNSYNENPNNFLQIEISPINNEISQIVSEYLNNKLEYHPINIRKEFLDLLLEKICCLVSEKKQHDKIQALFNIYHAFKHVDFSSYQSVVNVKEVIDINLDAVNTFSNALGKCSAYIRQTIFKTNYAVTMSDSSLLVGKLNDFIEQQTFPQGSKYY